MIYKEYFWFWTVCLCTLVAGKSQLVQKHTSAFWAATNHKILSEISYPVVPKWYLLERPFFIIISAWCRWGQVVCQTTWKYVVCIWCWLVPNAPWSSSEEYKTPLLPPGGSALLEDQTHAGVFPFLLPATPPSKNSMFYCTWSRAKNSLSPVRLRRMYRWSQ